MLIIKYIPIDEEHEPAIVEYNAKNVQFTEHGVRFEDLDEDEIRMVMNDKMIDVTYKVTITDEMRDLSQKRREWQKKQPRYQVGDSTVK